MTAYVVLIQYDSDDIYAHSVYLDIEEAEKVAASLSNMPEVYTRVDTAKFCEEEGGE